MKKTVENLSLFLIKRHATKTYSCVEVQPGALLNLALDAGEWYISHLPL
jgi:hypothetical protein